MALLLFRKQKSLEAYQAETVCMTRLQSEIVHLRLIVDTQQQLLDSMTLKNEMLNSDKFFAGLYILCFCQRKYQFLLLSLGSFYHPLVMCTHIQIQIIVIVKSC